MPIVRHARRAKLRHYVRHGLRQWVRRCRGRRRRLAAALGDSRCGKWNPAALQTALNGAAIDAMRLCQSSDVWRRRDVRKIVLLPALALGGCNQSTTKNDNAWPGHPVAGEDLQDAPWLDFQAPVVQQPRYKLTPVGDGGPDDVKCTSYGAVFGSAPYIQCRAQLDAARIIARRPE
jgi:hypothetical protein